MEVTRTSENLPLANPHHRRRQNQVEETPLCIWWRQWKGRWMHYPIWRLLSFLLFVLGMICPSFWLGTIYCDQILIGSTPRLQSEMNGISKRCSNLWLFSDIQYLFTLGGAVDDDDEVHRFTYAELSDRKWSLKWRIIEYLKKKTYIQSD